MPVAWEREPLARILMDRNIAHHVPASFLIPLLLPVRERKGILRQVGNPLFPLTISAGYELLKPRLQAVQGSASTTVTSITNRSGIAIARSSVLVGNPP